MLGRLIRLLSGEEPPPTEDPEDLLRLATCVILLEMAHADSEFTDDERGHVQETLATRFGMSRSDVVELMVDAAAEREASHDIWRFTHRINENHSQAEKIKIIEEIWDVIYADGTLDAHEDYLVHKLAKLLNLTHPQLISAKLKARDRAKGNG
jgi:uncharacterized tellurite resistance protein B-like protein